MKVIKCTVTGLYFKGFDIDGGLTFVQQPNNALDLDNLECTTTEAHVKRMIAAWHGKSWVNTQLSTCNI